MPLLGPLHATVTRTPWNKGRDRLKTLLTLRSKENVGFDETLLDETKHVRLIILKDGEPDPKEKINAFEFLNKLFLQMIGDRKEDERAKQGFLYLQSKLTPEQRESLKRLSQ